MSNYPPGCTDEHIDAQFMTSWEESFLEDFCNNVCLQSGHCDHCFDCEIADAAMEKEKDG